MSGACALCGGWGHRPTKCPWQKGGDGSCKTCGKKSPRECGLIQCGNRVTLTANSQQREDGAVAPRFDNADGGSR